MRTTLTIDEDNAVRLERLRIEQGVRFKEVVNAVLRQGLDARSAAQVHNAVVLTKAVDLGAFLLGSVADVVRTLDSHHDRKKLDRL